MDENGKKYLFSHVRFMQRNEKKRTKTKLPFILIPNFYFALFLTIFLQFLKPSNHFLWLLSKMDKKKNASRVETIPIHFDAIHLISTKFYVSFLRFPLNSTM